MCHLTPEGTFVTEKEAKPAATQDIILSPGRVGSAKRNFIFEYLGKCKEAYDRRERQEEGEYVQGLYNAWKHHSQRLGIPAGTPTAFRQVIYNMKKEGIIEHYATRPAEKNRFWDRNYYRVTLE